MFGLTKLELLGIAAAVGLVIATAAIAITYHKGEKAGEAGISAKVNETTVRTLDKARTEKERANEAVRNSPLDAVIDGLR